MNNCPYCNVKLANSARLRYHLANNACGKVGKNFSVQGGPQQSRGQYITKGVIKNDAKKD